MKLLKGDCLKQLKKLKDNSVDSIVTDPPYGLSFMGKKWDYQVPSVEVWRECLRVLKPGGHVLSFCGTRTYHRMVVNMEDAGFEIRDQLQWIYGQGFPKSLDISKAIDKAGGVSPREQAVLLKAKRESARMSREEVALKVGCTPSSVRDWEEGRARASGRPLEFIVPSEDYRAKLADLLGYTADERLLIGTTTDRRDDGSVMGLRHSGQIRSGGNTDDAKKWSGWGTALKPANEPICLARKPLDGTVVANVLKHGVGGINVDGCRIEGEKRHPGNYTAGSGGFGGAIGKIDRSNFDVSLGRFPSNVLLDEVAAEMLDEQTGERKSGGSKHERSQKMGVTSLGGSGERQTRREPDSGGASRFFYVAKASKRERNAGLEGMPLKKRSSANKMMGDAGPMKTGSGNDRTTEFLNHHPTVKPVALMQYLVRLITPKGGVCLDPFMGSGTTGVACVKEKVKFIGCELSEEYLEIARRRITSTKPDKAVKPSRPVEEQIEMFA
jgi:DNA modification methylase